MPHHSGPGDVALVLMQDREAAVAVVRHFRHQRHRGRRPGRPPAVWRSVPGWRARCGLDADCGQFTPGIGHFSNIGFSVWKRAFFLTGICVVVLHTTRELLCRLRCVKCSAGFPFCTFHFHIHIFMLALQLQRMFLFLRHFLKERKVYQVNFVVCIFYLRKWNHSHCCSSFVFVHEGCGASALNQKV